MLKVIESLMQGIRDWFAEAMRVYHIYENADKMGYNVNFLFENDNGQFLANITKKRNPAVTNERALVLSDNSKALGNFSGFDNWVLIN